MVVRCIVCLFFTLWVLNVYAQNISPVFVLPNYADTILEADRDTCIDISINAPETGDSVILWGESELFIDRDTTAYFLEKTGIGSLQTRLCFRKACRKVQGDPYFITLYARDSSFDTTIHYVRVRFKNSLQEELSKLPNVFTPNGDNLNDTFSLSEAKAQCENLFNVYIYNRWGQVVYSNNRISFKWDGGNCPAGVYYYIITSSGGINAQGIITLIR
jgi:gliding motility-associated-like protein